MDSQQTSGIAATLKGLKSNIIGQQTDKKEIKNVLSKIEDQENELR